MSTRRHASEEMLAELACAPLGSEKKPRVLIGGLGFGFTLKAALALLPRDATIVVAELLESVIAWNRNPSYPLASQSLLDSRVELRHQDVAETLAKEPEGFDAILLDVDNGPSAFTLRRNRSLYEKTGITAAQKALKPGGRLAYWSAVDDAGFAGLLRSCGLTAEIHRARAHGTSGPWHTLYLVHL